MHDFSRATAARGCGSKMMYDDVECMKMVYDDEKCMKMVYDDEKCMMTGHRRTRFFSSHRGSGMRLADDVP